MKQFRQEQSRMTFKLLNERSFQARGHYPAKPREKPERGGDKKAFSDQRTSHVCNSQTGSE